MPQAPGDCAVQLSSMGILKDWLGLVSEIGGWAKPLSLTVNFGVDLYRFDKMKTAPRNRMMKAFEEDLKPSFSNSEDEDFFICPIGGVPDDSKAGIEDGGFVMTRHDMKRIFDPVIDQIIPLVQGQINAVETQFHRGLRLSV